MEDGKQSANDEQKIKSKAIESNMEALMTLLHLSGELPSRLNSFAGIHMVLW